MPDPPVNREGFAFSNVEINWDRDGLAVQFAAKMKRPPSTSDWSLGLKFLVDVGTYESDGADERVTDNAKNCGVYRVLLLRPIEPLEQLSVPLRLVADGGKCHPTGIRVRDFESAAEEIKEAARRVQLSKLPRLQ